MLTLLVCLILAKKKAGLKLFGKIFLIGTMVLIDLFILSMIGLPVGMFVWLLS